MVDEERRPPDEGDAELEREIRAGRKYSLSEAIGRAAGDLMKGASPVTHERQAQLQVEQYLESHLTDSEGALGIVLQRRALASEELLARGYERPLEALAGIVEGLLQSPVRLRRFVRDVDAEWGRLYSERPYFEVAGAPPSSGDPYTLESVREALARLLELLRSEAGH